MKNFLLILLALISLVLISVPSVHAESFPSIFYCIGDNGGSCVTRTPTITSPACTPPPSCYRNGVLICMVPAGGWCGFTPSLQPSTPQTSPSIHSPSPATGNASPSSTSPSPSVNPCVTKSSTGDVQAFKHHPHMSRGAEQQFIQFLLQLLQLLFQLLGGQIPTPTPTPTPTPSASPSVSPNPCPSTAPSTSPSTAPSPTVFGTSPSPVVSSAPSTAPSQTNPSQTQPSSTQPSQTQPSNTQTSPSQSSWGYSKPNLTLVTKSSGTNCTTTKVPYCTTFIVTASWTAPTTTTTGLPVPDTNPTISKPASYTLKIYYNGASPSCDPTSGKTGCFGTVKTVKVTALTYNLTLTGITAPYFSITVSVTANGAPATSQTATVTTAPGKTPTPGKTALLESNIAAGTSKTNKLCLDDNGNGSANDSNAQTYACNSSDKAQQWTPYSDDTIRINGKCLDADQNSTANGTAVNLFACNGGKNQQWKLTTITSGTAKGQTELLGIQSSKCLDIPGSSTANGTHLDISTCNGGNNQAWKWFTGTVTSSNWAYLAPTGLKVTATTTTSVSLSWNAVTGSKPTVTGGVPKPTGYAVAVYNSSTGKLIKQITANATSATVTGLTAGSKININVWANGGPTAPPHASVTTTLKSGGGTTSCNATTGIGCSCTALGVAGKCQSTSTKAASGYEYVAGHCPGPATTQCYIKTPAGGGGQQGGGGTTYQLSSQCKNIGGTSCEVNPTKGHTNGSNGFYYAGYCPNTPNNVQCWVPRGVNSKCSPGYYFCSYTQSCMYGSGIACSPAPLSSQCKSIGGTSCEVNPTAGHTNGSNGYYYAGYCPGYPSSIQCWVPRGVNSKCPSGMHLCTNKASKAYNTCLPTSSIC